jgi:hypothetical protein
MSSSDFSTPGFSGGGIQFEFKCAQGKAFAAKGPEYKEDF